MTANILQQKQMSVQSTLRRVHNFVGWRTSHTVCNCKVSTKAQAGGLWCVAVEWVQERKKYDADMGKMLFNASPELRVCRCLCIFYTDILPNTYLGFWWSYFDLLFSFSFPSFWLHRHSNTVFTTGKKCIEKSQLLKVHDLWRRKIHNIILHSIAEICFRSWRCFISWGPAIWRYATHACAI
jgi:hypothetical protein